MKKLILILPLVLCGCFKTGPTGKVYAFWETIPTPPKTIRNPECLDSHMIEVFQISDDITLVQLRHCYVSGYDKSGIRACKNGSYSINNAELFAIKTKDFTDPKTLYDGSRMTLDDKCAVPIDRYSYFTALGTQKTVRIIEVIDSQTSNPVYEKWLAEQKTAETKEN